MKRQALAAKQEISTLYSAARTAPRVCFALLLGIGMVGCTGSITPVNQADSRAAKQDDVSRPIKKRDVLANATSETTSRLPANSVVSAAAAGRLDVDEVDMELARPAAEAGDSSAADVESKRTEPSTPSGEKPSAEVTALRPVGEPTEPAGAVSAEPAAPASRAPEQLASATPNVDLTTVAKKFVVPPLPPLRDGKRDATFDTIKFDMEKEDPFDRSLLTTTVEQLEGSRIRIRGYILPSFQQRGITQFVLVRDNMECCFGPGAALFDCIIVDMAPGKSANFTTRPVAVEGVFSINEVTYPDDETKHLAIYHMVADKVQ